jgi:hypothetical protein
MNRVIAAKAMMALKNITSHVSHGRDGNSGRESIFLFIMG